MRLSELVCCQSCKLAVRFWIMGEWILFFTCDFLLCRSWSSSIRKIVTQLYYHPPSPPFIALATHGLIYPPNNHLPSLHASIPVLQPPNHSYAINT